MHYSLIKQFIDQFKSCPKCGHRLKINAKQKEEMEYKRVFNISTVNDRLIIYITSEYFIKDEERRFEFSISILDGNILYSDSANKFVSLYDLDIILYKDCAMCPQIEPRPSEAFYQSINIFYDRNDSIFTALPWVDFFSFVYNDSYCYFSNDFRDKKSFLVFQPLKLSPRNPIIYTPFIPFEKFEFKNKEKLFNKVNSIRLLI